MSYLSFKASRLSFAAFILMPLALLVACQSGNESAELKNTPSRIANKGNAADTPAAQQGTKGHTISRAVRGAIEGLSAQKKLAVRSRHGRVTKIAGPIGFKGISPQNAFQQFMAAHGDVLDIDARDIAPGQWQNAAQESIPLMYDAHTDSYRFTLTRHHQVKNGIPVYGSRVDVLTMNKGNQIVGITARTRNLDGFAPRFNSAALNSANKSAALATIKSNRRHVQRAKAATNQSLRIFSEPTLTIWAGAQDELASPQLAVAFTGTNDNRFNKPETWRFVADAETGEILYKENMILFEDVAGTVNATAINGIGPDICDPTHVVPMARAAITAETGASVFANDDGSFVLPNPGTEPIEMTSAIAGEFFVVGDEVSTREEILTQTVTPPGPATFDHAVSPDAYVLAQSNAYVQSNIVRDWLLQFHPTYPQIANQVSFPVYVNLTSGYCPGNAWYDYSSINFCEAGGQYPNTAFASVIHHEYGHHIVSSGGSGQDEYGEGMSDVVSMLIVDDPRLGVGFYGDCNTSLRTADNNCQYLASGCSTCGSASHSCGQLLSGIIWDIREALVVTEPDNYLDILSALVVNSVPLHSGTSINADIAVDLLTLDDLDGDIGNGTPHRAEICAGFEAHGIECPELQVGLSVNPTTPAEIHGDSGGPFTPNELSYNIGNYGPGTIDFTAAVDVSWLTLSTTGGTLNLGDTAAVTVSVNEGANVLPDGVYDAQVTFENATDHVGDTSVSITLTVGGPQPIYTWDLDSNPGWTMDTGWQFGVPTGGGTDPDAAATGTNIFGTNLSGNYSNYMDPHSLTTGAIDCANLSAVSLQFQRWLGVETRNYDEAEISISTDGVTFTPIWQNPFSTVNESSWALQEIDLSSIADGEPTVYLRWTLGPTDYSVVYGGWNLDDIVIWGIQNEQPICTTNEECNDGVFCNGEETCNLEAGVCDPGTPVDCNDDVECTLDVCNNDSASCEHQTRDTFCNDGLFCNGEETCATDGCVAGTPVTCDDGVACTQDVCNNATASCEVIPDDTQCDDSVYCNGVETCSTEGCIAGSDPCVDGIECTVDQCNETVQTCDYIPDDSVCDNGLFCDGAETCDVGAGCSNGATPCPEQCDENFDVCISCSDDTQNGAETDIDCGGGFCDPCENGLNCELGEDCQSGICDNGICAAPAPTCTDAMQNGSETDVDCGGDVCSPCSDGLMCLLETDCQSGNCQDGICAPVAPTCDDSLQNGLETDVDCGGAVCDACANGQMCQIGSDCLSENCDSGICAPVAPTCDDSLQNGLETDVDCGGAVCDACANGQMCQIGSDCLSGNCDSGICAPPAPACDDSIQNGLETDVDCGGGVCDTCADGLMCLIGGDCQSGNCLRGICAPVAPTCDDSIQNGLETDVDCGGGECDACTNGLMCEVGSDCQSGNCQDGVCQTQPSNDLIGELQVTTDWGTGYCVMVVLSNQAAAPTTSWELAIDLHGAQAYTQWNAFFSGNSGVIDVTPYSWNSVIYPGQSNTSVGFCANRSGNEPAATLVSTVGHY